jgi:hypothetical protein
MTELALVIRAEGGSRTLEPLLGDQRDRRQCFGLR